MPSCSKCHRSETEVTFKTRRSGKPQSYCADCQREYNKAHYTLHKKEANARRQKNCQRMRLRLRKIISDLKKNPCTDCKIPYPPWVMQFDHLKGKTLDVSAMVSKSYGLKRILEEIKKCELVCANCHADRTHRRSDHSRVA